MKMCRNNVCPTGLQKLSIYLIVLLCFGLSVFISADLYAQRSQGTMEVAERDEATGEAVRFNFNFTSDELKNLFEYLARETNLTIIASEDDIQGKRFALINLQNVTLDEVIEHVKTVLARYNLTFVRVNSTLIVTTFEKATVMNVPIKRISPDPEQVEMTDEIQTYIIQLENASAADQAGVLKPLLNNQANIFADSMTNALVITEVSSNVRRIVSILQFADEGEKFPLKIAIVPLTYADAASIETTLNKVFEDNKEDTNSARGTIDMDLEQIKQAIEQGIGVALIDGMIKVYADTNSNSLIIKATEENLTILREIILHLDKAPTLSTEIRTYHLEYATAEDVTTTLEEIITGDNIQGGGRRSFDREDILEMMTYRRREGSTGDLFQGIVGLVNISRDDRLNIVFISSDPRNFTMIEKIIEVLDQKQSENEFKMYLLEFADAATLKENLTQLFEGEDTGGDSYRSWWDRDSRSSNQDTGFGVQGTVHMVEDLRLNALLISTSAQNFPMIDELVKKLDVNLPDQEWGSRIFYLKHADAENVSNLINTHYQGNNDNVGNYDSYYYYRYYLPQRQTTNQAQGALAGNVSAQPLASHNALIVSTGTKRNFDLIEDFIKQLDIPTPPPQTEVTDIIRLEYATADSIAQVLAQVWQDPQAEDDDGFSRFFRSSFDDEDQTDINSLFGKVTVYADPDTNSLIVTTRQRYLEQVKALIKQLDFVRGQVRIDIKILEVTLDETTKLGIEMAANEKRLAGLELSPDNPLIGDTKAQLGLGQEISGFNYSLATKEYVALLHTLIRENKVKTLSTPTITTRDSRPATWSSGRRIPYLQSVDTNSILGDTATQPLFNYDFIDPPVGINISLTPYIARSQAGEDGKRTIGLDITNISASNFIEFTEFNAPITDDNSLTAYVDVEDGQQLIVGGIIRKKQKEVENKVPFLGDIPLLGRLFKSTETEVQDTEIVFIITPHIFDIKQPDDIKKQKEIADDWQKNGKSSLEESIK
ncbi:MAG: hypothetical protein OXD54_04140 [Candidatus Poribacteria bacterium]|nr:hypothetical protein [Candidatus Poribacteria bacterium]